MMLIDKKEEADLRMLLMQLVWYIIEEAWTSLLSSMMEQMYRQELAKSEEIEKVALRTYFDNFKDKSFHSLGM